jgi:hypothetical protein
LRNFTRFVALFVALCLATTAPARGSMILATDGSVSYDQGTGNFDVTATGLFLLSNNLPLGASQVPIDGGSANLNLTVDQNGNLVSPGSLTVTGAIDIDQDGKNDVSGSLVTATVNSFSPSGAGPAPWSFQGAFKFDGGGLTMSSIPLSGGGSFADTFLLGGDGTFNLVIESQVSGILGNFLQSFSGSTVKGLPVSPVPEPASSSLLLAGAATIAGLGVLRFHPRRRRTPTV